MNYTESEDDLNQKRRSSQWNPSIYVPETDEEDDEDEIRKKIETLFDEEDDEEDPKESGSEHTEVGCGSGESETPADGSEEQASEGHKDSEGEDSRDSRESGIRESRGFGESRDSEEVEEKSAFVLEILTDGDDETGHDSSEDGITITEWKDKNIVKVAENSGKTVIKSKYLTAVPVDLFGRKTEQPETYTVPETVEKQETKTFYIEDEDVYVPPEEDSRESGIRESRGFGDSRESQEEEAEAEISDEDLDYNDVFQNDPEILRKRKVKRKITGAIGKILKEAVAIILIFVVSVFLVATFNVLFRRQNEVFGTSMEPNFVHGDVVYSSYFEYITGEPKIGDIVIFDYSAFNKNKAPTFFTMLGDVLQNNKLTQFVMKKEPSQDTYWIKRVVGVGGDTIEFRDGQFYRNGEPIYEEYIKEQIVTSYPSNGSTIVVPEGYVFLMGDNRNVSHDSRAIGCVPVKYIIGKCK